MRVFQLWFTENGQEHLLAQFRETPSRRVWEWFESIRSGGQTTQLDMFSGFVNWNQFRLASLPDFGDIKVGLPLQVNKVVCYKNGSEYKITLREEDM